MLEVIALVDILMATYNGEKFISMQLDSILNQSFKDWHLYINDDNSSDSTCEIVKKYQEKYPDKISFSKSPSPLGAKGNFFKLMEFSKSEYIMFCDQDDVWNSDKIEKTLNKMKETENDEKDIPVLVHTDLKVVNENLDVINPSYFKLSRIKNETALNKAIVQNCVTGCTVMINKALLNLAGENNENIIMHDWWLYLIASAFGKIGFINTPTILYRQHSKNEVGAKPHFMSFHQMNVSINKTISQSACFLERYISYFSEKQHNLINVYSNIKLLNPFTRLFILNKHKIYKSPFLKKIMQKIIIFCLSTDNKKNSYFI